MPRVFVRGSFELLRISSVLDLNKDSHVRRNMPEYSA